MVQFRRDPYAFGIILFFKLLFVYIFLVLAEDVKIFYLVAAVLMFLSYIQFKGYFKIQCDQDKIIFISGYSFPLLKKENVTFLYLESRFKVRYFEVKGRPLRAMYEGYGFRFRVVDIEIFDNSGKSIKLIKGLRFGTSELFARELIKNNADMEFYNIITQETRKKVEI